VTESWDFVQAVTAVLEGLADAEVTDGLGDALVGFADADVAAGVEEGLEEPDGAATGVPSPPRPVSSHRTPRSSTIRTRRTTPRRTQ
jgi:hypothetical protein